MNYMCEIRSSGTPSHQYVYEENVNYVIKFQTDRDRLLRESEAW